jgi:hypothetical protein
VATLAVAIVAAAGGSSYAPKSATPFMHIMASGSGWAQWCTPHSLQVCTESPRPLVLPVSPTSFALPCFYQLPAVLFLELPCSLRMCSIFLCCVALRVCGREGGMGREVCACMCPIAATHIALFPLGKLQPSISIKNMIIH